MHNSFKIILNAVTTKIDSVKNKLCSEIIKVNEDLQKYKLNNSKSIVGLKEDVQTLKEDVQTLKEKVYVIKFDRTLDNIISSSSQPFYYVSNLDNAEIINLVKSGCSFAIMDLYGSCYYPVYTKVDSSNNTYIDFIIMRSGTLYYVDLCCTSGSTKFYRNLWYSITLTAR